jgi:hypothetical protein
VLADPDDHGAVRLEQLSDVAHDAVHFISILLF